MQIANSVDLIESSSSNEMVGSAATNTDADIDYAALLASFGLKSRRGKPWLSVGTTDRVQGWKLHVSSTVTQAPTLLRAVLPILIRAKVSFKIAANPTTLVRLNDGSLGQPQIGKFMTVYPESDTQAKSLAADVSEATSEFHGPDIATDLWLGGLVYARYGAFRPRIRRDRFGQSIATIESVDGRETLDSYTVPDDSSIDPDHPFSGLVLPRRGSSDAVDGKTLFGPGLFLTDVLQAQAKGSVYRAIDVRDPDRVRGVILKEGRAHCCSDFGGRDIRSRLIHQLALHRQLSKSLSIPAADEYFEVDGNGYLVMEYIEGSDLRQMVERRWSSLTPVQELELYHYLVGLAEILTNLHRLGYVHRDIKPANIRIDPGGKVWLLDLELAHAMDSQLTPYQLGTPGYMSPEQEHLQAPDYSDDIYGVGAILLQATLDIHPSAILFAEQSDRDARIRGLAQGLSSGLVELVCDCVAMDALRRPSASQVVERLRDILKAKSLTPEAAANATLQAGCRGILHATVTDPILGVWMSDSFDRPGTPEVMISASRGAAGPVYLVGRLLRCGVENEDLIERAETVARWLITEPATADQNLPGLHFGKAGVAVALAEAVSAGILPPDRAIRDSITRALGGIIDWPDVTHGAAGQGLAAMYCADRLGDLGCEEPAHECAEYLLGNQRHDGAWAMPEGVDKITGEVFYGFAHGVGGIVYFLAEYARRFQDQRVESAWRRAVDWLLAQAIELDHGRSLGWHWSDRNTAMWNWWCHGAAGLSLLFLRLFEQTGESRFADVARRALQPAAGDPVNLSLGQCHGLAGFGEAYLEAARVLGDPQWIERSNAIGNLMIQLQRETENGCSFWSVDNTLFPTADLQVGSGGIVHFLLRWTGAADRIGPPLLLDPLG